MIEVALEVAGETLVLNQERAIWWPAAHCLMVADVHFGKGSVLRQSGIAVPTGQTDTDIARLDSLIEQYQPNELIVLGDLVHGRSPPDAQWVEQVASWRTRHGDVAMRLVAGNHDRHFDSRLLGFEVIEHEWLHGAFLLRHAPTASERGYVLAGHVHPSVSVRDGWRRHRFPAFRFEEKMGTLPAFGSLTGLHEKSVSKGERIVAVTPAGLLSLGDTPAR